jgi:hypothetical protein
MGAGMCRIVSKATDELVPVDKSIDHIDDAGGNIAREIGKLRCKAMYDKETEEGLRDRLAEVTKFHGETTDVREVLYN